MPTDLAAHTETLRRFNRTYTQRIGALDDSFLGTGRTLAHARLLFEVGPAGAGVRDLRERLGLDSGYLSRLVAGLEAEGLVALDVDAADRRRRVVALTDAGRTAWARLEARSQERALLLVEPLTERQRVRLSEALATADLLVRAATVRLEEVDPASPGARAAVAAYVAELVERFPDGFDPGDPDAPSTLRAPGGTFVLATSDGEPVACGGVQPLGPGVGEIKRMWVHPGWRGAGLGARMLRHLEGAAAALGHAVVRLDTNRALGEAIGMYQRAGYAEIGRYNDNPYAEAFFEKALPPR